MYSKIIDEVCDASQVDFEEGGVDADTLKLLKQVSNRSICVSLDSVWCTMGADLVWPLGSSEFIRLMRLMRLILLIRLYAVRDLYQRTG